MDTTQTRGLDEGFSLVELLVVIIIIGILAGIAIAVFLAQRTQAYDASAVSDLRQVATYEESYLYYAGTYGPLASLPSDGDVVRLSPGVTVTLVHYLGATGYCLSSHQVNSTHTWFWDSAAGGLQPGTVTSCPVTTVGASGGSLTGP
ncbi:MAG: prepilin-type N-terminal cleavage/methylation domain-containing protein [Mycobacteriales bacterium]